MPCARENVIVAMSGGVDSSVAASVLLEQGYEVTGVFLCLGSAAGAGDESSGCCTPADAADARRVAQTLGIELYVLNVAEQFERIIDYFAAEYARGRTPNPCVHCNAQIKFARLIRLADSMGAGYVATGHHARIVTHEGRLSIARGRDRQKDQSYALFGIARENLARILLPIGEIDQKARVRQLARALGLNVHDKRDSQEICFVRDDDYAALLRARAPQALRPGPILDAAGEVLGRHDGFAQFTIGQRRGLKVAAGEPMYVSRIDARTAAVTIGPKEQVLGTHLSASGANWHCDVPAEFDATVQVRYNHRGAPGRVRVTGRQVFEVTFSEPVAAITPGQATAVYDGERLLGGGWIDS